LVYNKYIRNPSTGLITLATIIKDKVDDTLMYSESISEIFEAEFGAVQEVGAQTTFATSRTALAFAPVSLKRCANAAQRFGCM
jgi:hypothetical protein